MIEATFSNWSNPGAIAAVLALRSLFDPVVLGYVADEFGPRSIYTAVVGCLVVLSTALTAVLLTTGWLGHTTSYAEQLSQLLLVGVSGYAFTRRRSKRTPAPLLLAWTGAVGLSLVMVPIYGEAFVAP